MSPEQLEAEHRAWCDLSPTDQWLLRLIVLEGWISEPAQIVIAWQLLLGVSGAPPKAPAQTTILRQARLLPHWVDVRHQQMQATEALRRQALPEAETRQIATHRLQQEVRKLPVRWSPYGGHYRFTVVVSWLLTGAAVEQPQTVHALPDHSLLTRALHWIMPPHYDPDVFARLSSSVRREWVVDGYSAAVYATDPDLPYWRAQTRTLDPSDQAVVEHIPMMLDDSLLCGAQLAAELQPDWLDLSVHATQRCLQQADLAWLDDLEAAVKAFRKATVWDRLTGLSGLLHWLLLLADQGKASLRRLRSLSRIHPSKIPSVELVRQRRLAEIASAWLQGTSVPIEHCPASDPLGWWLELVLGWWRDLTPTEAQLQTAEAAIEHARAIGWTVLATELRATVARCRGEAEGETPRIIDLRERQADWERTLEALEALAAQVDTQPARSRSHRLQVRAVPLPDYLDDHHRVTLHLIPELANGKTGKSKQLRTGRAINSALALWPADRPEARILQAALQDLNEHRYESPEYALGNPESRTLKAALGYSDVVGEKNQPLSLLEGRPRLALGGDHKGTLRLSLDAPFDPTQTVSWLHDGDVWHRYEPNEQQRLLRGLLNRPQSLPSSALQRLSSIAQRLQPWAELALGEDAGAVRVSPRTDLHLLLEWQGEGLLVQPRVRPLGLEQGPYATPGQGPTQCLGSVDGLPTLAERDLAVERSRAQETLERLDLPADCLDEADPTITLDAEAALALLARAELIDPKPWLAWPKGGERRVLQAGALRLNIASGRDWIGVEGQLGLADGSTLALNQLLTLIRAGESRFVRLDQTRLLRLDRQLRAQLRQLEPLSDQQGKLQLHPLAAPVLAQALGDHQLTQATALQQLLGKRAQAFALKPKLPGGFQAELRDYQLAGFQWLQRMAAWGAGACLADDMGLGKTVQCLALLCARAKQGPALIVAPTSVLGNWAAEARRFAPGLRVSRYEQSADRGELLGQLGPGDVLLVSYTLLALDIESLASRPYASLVLDEAQAIKNANTQRARAACLLKGDFRVALTGTPIENHLGELWSLMRFLNPGLLGSEQRFVERFQRPIEAQGDTASAARSSLRQLISGFVLRRTKAQVLQELPERTEITLRIEPGPEEARLQQAMRQQALERLEQNQAQPAGARRFSILAELMRLRRGACHPQLYSPELKLGSAKLDQLVELLIELRDNHHRALVFSQFVDYLTLVRQALEAQGISYQYLDGSTPSSQREKIVAAFQQGEGDCFLLSLKAGGSGLNLTAADYVIHLDPWWNPAVEQQASDRAHRIGQTRPVTVYRLVLADSIEERILALHGAKRELMDSVLAEADGGGALSEDDLLALLSPD